MKIGKQGLTLIKEFEGLRLKAYLCPAKVWTIGYGHTDTAKKDMVITERQAERLLKGDLGWVEATIANSVVVPLTQQQYDALCSFIYNVGSGAFRRSTLLELLNAGHYVAAEDQFKRWNKASGKTLSGLTRRREAERALFASEPNATSPAPTQGLLAALLEALRAILSATLKNRS